jgi:hypothetical protein
MLCEKQFRKGFHQGYHACKNNMMTKTQVDNWRAKGVRENYTKVVLPHNGQKMRSMDVLAWEMDMPIMMELIYFLHNQKIPVFKDQQ